MAGLGQEYISTGPASSETLECQDTLNAHSTQWTQVGHRVAGIDSGGTAPDSAGNRAFWGVIIQIAVIDMVFSLDSVITAVGLVEQIWVMVAAVATSVGLMLFAAKPIGNFVSNHPSVKVLALSFLVLVGMALTAQAFDVHVPKAYIYASMAFALVVEALNLRHRARRKGATGPSDSPPAL